MKHIPISEQQLVVATKWWREKLVARRAELGREPVSDDKLAAFESVLRTRILEEGQTDQFCPRLEFKDDLPTPALAAALREADLQYGGAFVDGAHMIIVYGGVDAYHKNDYRSREELLPDQYVEGTTLQNPLTPAQIETAVAWWTNDLAGPTFQLTNPNSGEIGNEAVTRGEGHLTVRAATAPRHPPDVLEKFSAALREGLTRPLGSFDNDPWLNVDYHPCCTLRNAIKAAGIDRGYVLSVKTRMWFENGGVQVAHGYQNPSVDLPLEKKAASA